jgi:hypothetical protein
VIPIRGEKGLDASHGIQAYGPVSDAKGRLEFARLTETYDAIRAHGYRPTAPPEAGDPWVLPPRRGRLPLRGGCRPSPDGGARRAGVRPRVKFYPHHPRSTRPGGPRALASGQGGRDRGSGGRSSSCDSSPTGAKYAPAASGCWRTPPPCPLTSRGYLVDRPFGSSRDEWCGPPGEGTLSSSGHAHIPGDGPYTRRRSSLYLQAYWRAPYPAVGSTPF